MQWNHAPFTVETYPLQHDQCGEITYEAFFNGQPVALQIDPNTGDPLNTSPLQYDPQTGVFTFFTDSPDLIGTHEYSIRAYLTKYHNTAASGSDIMASASNKIVVQNACHEIDQVTNDQPDTEKFYNYGEHLSF